MDQLNITEKGGDTFLLIELDGSLNSYTYTDFQNRMYDLIKTTNLCIDMSKVTNCSSAGLGVLMTLHEDAELNKRKLFILRPSPIVKLALDSTGFIDLFSIIQNVSEINI